MLNYNPVPLPLSRNDVELQLPPGASCFLSMYVSCD